MKYGLVIVENRTLPYLNKVISNHKKYTGWDVLQVKANINQFEDYNKLLTSVPFWENIKKQFDQVLIFQHDSQLLRHGIQQFTEWDYIGAPWVFQNYGGNGGLSFRTVNTMLEICKKEVRPEGMNEDIFFSKHVPNYGKLAPVYIAKQFSVETVFFVKPIGVHAPWKWLQAEQVNKIYEYTTEIPIALQYIK